MKFLDALSSPAFWAYAASLAALLAGCWLALYRARRLGREPDPVWRTVWAWGLLAGILTLGLLLGREVFAVLTAMVALFACREFARATGLYADWPFTGLVYLCILAVNLVAVWPGYDAFMATPVYAVALLCLLPVARNRAEGMLPRVALAVMAFVYFGYFLAHLTLLTAYPLPQAGGYLLFLLYGTATADVVGRLANSHLGRRRLAPGISADATWEGAAAGLGWALVWSVTVGLTMPAVPWGARLLAGLLLGVVAPAGGFVLRHVFRDLGLPPGAEPAPNPVLGRLHCLLFVAPLFFRLVHWFDPAFRGGG